MRVNKVEIGQSELMIEVNFSEKPKGVVRPERRTLCRRIEPYNFDNRNLRYTYKIKSTVKHCDVSIALNSDEEVYMLNQEDVVENGVRHNKVHWSNGDISWQRIFGWYEEGNVYDLHREGNRPAYIDSEGYEEYWYNGIQSHPLILSIDRSREAVEEIIRDLIELCEGS
jgi:hypothetical protein